MPALSPETVAKVTGILNQLDEHPLPRGRDERRHTRRVPLRTSLQVTLLSEDPSRAPVAIQVFARNISPSGLGFVCRRMFCPGERIAISLIIGPLPPRLLQARITHSRYLKAGLYEMGAEFLACIPHPAGAFRVPAAWLHPPRLAPIPDSSPASPAPRPARNQSLRPIIPPSSRAS